MEQEKEIIRILEAIRQRIRDSPLNQRKIEECSGFSRGYLSQLLNRNLELKVVHLLAILDALGIEPAAFFRDLYPDPRRPGLAHFERQAQEGARPASHRHEMDPLHSVGLASLRTLRERLERCEDAVAQLEDLGVLAQVANPEEA